MLREPDSAADPPRVPVGITRPRLATSHRTPTIVGSADAVSVSSEGPKRTNAVTWANDCAGRRHALQLLEPFAPGRRPNLFPCPRGCVNLGYRKDARSSSGDYLVDRPLFPMADPFATTPQVDTARKACPGTAQWARFPSSEVTKEVTSIRIQNSTHFPGPSRTPLSLKETHSRRSRSLRDGATISMRAPSRLSASQQSDGGPATAWKPCPASAVSRSPTGPDHPQWSRCISST